MNIKEIKNFNSSLELMEFALGETNEEGLLLEFGVHKGGTINFISKKIPNKIIYGFDSFEGLPEDWRPGFLKGCFNVNGVLPEVNSNVNLIKGWFSETLPNFILDNTEQKISFMHIDCDLYSSTKFILENTKNLIKNNTIILFDEFYNYSGWEQGEYKAWQEFILQNPNIKFEYIGININHEQVAVRITNV